MNSQLNAAERVAELNGLSFKPKVIHLNRNDSITFINTDYEFHNIYSTSKKDPIHLGAIANNDRKTHTFKKRGVIELRCAAHHEMSMIVKVK